MSKKNCPPGDPPGGPKSLLEAKKSLLEMKIGASDAFWHSMIDFQWFLEEKNKIFCSVFKGSHRYFASCLDIVVHLGTP